MTTYAIPTPRQRPAAEPRTVYTVASGDLRLTTNLKTWSMQQQVEAQFAAAVGELGWQVKRAHGVDPVTGHGFIDNQRKGMDVFATIPLDAPLVVVEAVWQYSHHVLAGLRDHQGPILVVANFAGDFPGLVGLLNLTGSMTKAGIKHSALWSKDFTDDWAKDQLKTWLEVGEITHDISHVRDLPALPDSPERDLGVALAAQLRNDKGILAVFDEGCMGMYNAIFDDELLNPTGIYKERLSQSALYAEMLKVGDDEAAAIRAWLDARGMTFHVDNEGDWKECLTDEQLTWQFKMYAAALRIADDFGADAVGIQYQQGLKDVVPASDLAEGLLNDPDRPPVLSRDGSRVLFEGKALPHFNEVDEGVAVDADDRDTTADRHRQIGAGSGGRHDQARDGVGDGDPDELRLELGLVVGVAEHHPQAGRPGDVGHRAHHGGEEGVLHVGHEHRDDLRRLGPQPAGVAVGDEAQLGSRRAHGRHPLRRDGRAVEHTRHRGRGHPRARCDVVDGGHPAVPNHGSIAR